MTVLNSILFGMLQGVLEFLPVSSFGHIFLLLRSYTLSLDYTVLFGVFLHIGTLIPIIYIFRKDVGRILLEYPGLLLDLLTNLRLYLRNRRSDRKRPYNRVIQSSHRKLAALILVAAIPTGLIAFTARNLFVLWCETPVMPAIGFLMTGIVLLVVDFSNTQGNITIKNANMDQAMWIGIGQGISIFPGLSRGGLAMGMGILCGDTRLFAIKVAYLSSIPAVIGSAIYQFQKIPAMDLTSEEIGCCIAGMIAAAVVGSIVIRVCLKIVKKMKFRFFAIYCFLLGGFIIKQIYM